MEPEASWPTGGNADAANKDMPTDNEKAATGAGKRRRLVIVVSKRNPVKSHSLNVSDLRRVFLRQKTLWPNGWSITVFERSASTPIRHEFSKRVLKKNPRELKTYWMNLQLTRALRPPKVLRSAKLVKAYLHRVKGGISYMYEDQVDDTVKVIEIRGLEDVRQSEG